jgi:DNA-directed RNA polymerase subunit RPC12/RpoP
MKLGIFRLFTDSAAALLLAMAAAIWISNHANAGLSLPHDPILNISMRTTFWMAGAMASVVALVCLFSKPIAFKAGLILWLALNLLAYQAGFVWGGSHRGLGGYLNSVANTFDLPVGATSLILKIASGYLFIGSLMTLLWLWREKAQGYLKAVCAHCGGHIAFAPKSLGQKIPCPHCQKETTLRKPDLLKMACFFCKEHIEFPAHAIGEKIPCPHCKMDITLKDPA